MLVKYPFPWRTEDVARTVELIPLYFTVRKKYKLADQRIPDFSRNKRGVIAGMHAKSGEIASEE
jgi:hypothetical protein